MSVRKSVFISVAVLAVCSMVGANHRKGSIPGPANIADGADPMPNPYPRPPAILSADGTDPMPNPYPKPPARS
jgi:hypothetical protein